MSKRRGHLAADESAVLLYDAGVSPFAARCRVQQRAKGLPGDLIEALGR